MATAKKARRAERRDGKRSSEATESQAEARRLDRVRALIKILEGSTLAELEYEDADVVVKLRRGSTVGSVSASVAPPAPPLTQRPAPAPKELDRDRAAAEEPGVHVIRSPFVGTFYRAPQPEAPAYTDVGQTVRRGQTVCIVEAMKLMNEIESEVDGTVLEVLVKNGAAVQYGDPLMRIKVA